MDSQATLVSPTTPAAHAILYFDKNSMRNTTLRHVNGDVTFTVHSNNSCSRTELREGTTDIVVAAFAFRDLLPDTVQFCGEKKMKLNDWLSSRKRL
jgi:hypothetical protein